MNRWYSWKRLEFVKLRTYGIIGHSIAGIAAALELVGAETEVVQLPNLMDNLSIGDLYQVRIPNLASGLLSGHTLEVDLLERLTSLGIRAPHAQSGMLSPTILNVDRNKVQIGDATSGSFLQVDAAIYAPIGTVSLPLSLDHLDRYLGKGLCYSAAVDGPYLRHKNVVVVGSGVNALHQAAVMTKWAELVTLVSGEPFPKPLPVWIPPSSGNMRVLENTTLGRIDTRPDGWIEQVTVVSSGEEVPIRCDAILIAADPEVSWSLFGGEDEARRLAESGFIVLTGLAANVPYGNGVLEWNDGVRAAHQLAGRRS